MEAVMGTDKNAPGTPQTKLQKIKEAMTTTGCKSMPSPKKRGSIRLPMVNSKAIIKPSTTKKLAPKPYCRNRTGAGNSTAMIEPTLGIKFNRKKNMANKNASLTLKATSTIQISSAVTKEVTSFTDRYLDTCASISCTVGLALVGTGFLEPSNRKTP